ncbi:hypothetical protein GEV33_008564 [Tenebrio molitor]|uniref:Uncharacterized protein n=1 Tax=Tenebrio molitor TaxID=7067 RepID=A0A8J6HII8_TENMO|nr:hypothetical protein GEV33_008564 [Tenebrio molitor]
MVLFLRFYKNWRWRQHLTLSPRTACAVLSRQRYRSSSSLSVEINNVGIGCLREGEKRQQLITNTPQVGMSGAQIVSTELTSSHQTITPEMGGQYRSLVENRATAVARQFAMELKRRNRIILYMNKIVKKTKSEERNMKVAPLHRDASTDNDIREFCGNCPSTSMSRFQERDILRKVNARGLELNYPVLLNNIITEAREEFLKVTQRAGIAMKLRSVQKQYQIEPYKLLGKTKNYPVFLQRRKEFQAKFILHHPLIRRILNECVTKLPYELFNLNLSLKSQLDTKEFQKHIFDYANDAAQRLQEFYRKIVVLVEHEKVNTQHARSYLGACTGLLSVNISRTIAHTLLHVVSFTGSKEHIPYLKLNITFKDRLILEPTAEDVIEIYNKFLRKIIDGARQFYVLEKYRIKGFDNKQIHLCLTDEFFHSIITQIAVNIREKYEPILKYIKNLDNEFVDIYGDLCSEGNTISTSDLIFEEGCKKLLYFKSYLPKVAFIPDNAYFTIGQLIITDYREILKQTLLNIIENIFNNLSAQHEWENDDICEAFDIIYVRATQKPITTEEVIEIGKYMAWVRTDYLDELKERVFKALAYLTKLIQLGPLRENHIIINAKAINWLDEILPVLEENIATFEQLKFEAEEKLQRVIEDINVDIKDVYPLLDILDSMDNIENVRNYLNTITLHMVKIKKIESKIDWINREEVSLSFPKSSYAEFEELKNYVYPFYHLLKLCLDVQRNLSVWLDGQFDLINYEKVKNTVEKYYKELLRTQKVYRNKLRQAQDANLSLRFKGTVDDPDMLNWPAPLKLCSKAIKLIQDFEPSLAVIKIMCNEALMKRHWQKMSGVAGFDITPNAGTTLKKIIQIDLKPDIDKYELISFSATKERELLENLEKMQREWTDVNFATGDYKEIQIIVQLEDIEVVADDHIIKVINMLNSIYVKPYDNQVKHFYNRLLEITKTLQECRQTQQQWLHFFPLFLCHQITIQMPQESQIFKQISNTYTNYVEMIHTRPNVYTTVNNTNILPDLLHCNQQFELINQGVNRYFDKIRQYFPRFYFVSNEEMFRILSLTNDPTGIRRFIKSLFHEIKNLKFDENAAILGILSEHDEILHLLEDINTQQFQGCVEMWLKELESQIRMTIRRMIGESFKNHDQENWILNWSCQVLTVVTRIVFTIDTHNAIKNNTLDSYQTQIQDNLERVVAVVRSAQLDNTKTITVRSIIVMLTNNREIVCNLKSSQIKSDQDFRWLSQIRYYLLDDDNCVVKILDNHVPYGNEYVGNGQQIVITPTTERCYHALMLAYKYHLCGNLQGPTGTGKTGIIKSLAGAVAIQCTFYNCSRPVKFEVIVEFLKGVVSNGSWLVLENFQTIQVEICSILSQEISKISTALKGGLNAIVLNSTELTLQKCFICCSMKGLERFPDSFKILFRPVAMTVPDSLIIAQVFLLSFGYRDSSELGRRIITINKLMEDLLPQSKTHFGIRLIKEILNKCAEKFTVDTNEAEIIYNCICQITLPRLSANELVVFKNILLQHFPSAKLEALMPNFEDSLITVCRQLNLEGRKEFLVKVVELNEIMRCNTGVIIVGQTFTGKTTLVRVLQTVHDKTINVRTLSPKTMTLKQLYGRIDAHAQQWCDGIITKYLREYSDDEDWIVLDGPADSLWIDDLNTVLDENRKLCLASGEVIHLTQNKRIIFEIENLNQASPAMVSRCGIIYMDPYTINWKPLLSSWLRCGGFEWQEGYEENFTTLFDWIIPPCLEYVKSDCQQLCKINELSLVKTTIQVLEMLLIEAYDAIQRKEEDVKNLSSWIQASFIQAVIWGVGSNLDLNSRAKFDEFFKQLWRGQNKSHPYPKLLEKVEVGVPVEEMIFDHSYFYKSKDGVHITLGSYLEFIRLYVHLVIFKQKKIMDVKQRYLAALEKLSFAAFQISEMQKSLADYQPQLEAMTVQAIEMAKQIEKETNEVEKASDLVKKDEEIANEQAAAAQVLKLDCEADLAQAIPILEDAISALNTLKPTDITLVKSMKNPPDAIKLVMAAVCVIKDVKPDRIPDPSTGRKTIDYWGPSKRILGDMNFLQTLKDFDKDNIKPEIMVKIRKDYLPHKDFKPHTVAKASSAAEGLCKWIIAMDMYDKVAKEVAPKKEKLEKAEREYGTTMAILNEKKEQVSRIEQKLADLNELLKEATRKQQKLQRDVDICKKKLNRAQKLIGGLSEEKSRWTNAVDQLEKQYDRLAGDILLSTAVIAYLGPFRADNRHKTLSEWLSSVSQNGIPFKEKYDFVEAFEKDLDFDKWHLNGLPTDRFFIENGIIGTMSKRWSLYIDPQNQANMWIKISEKQNGIKVTKFTCQDYLTVMKDCITSGTPLLLENVGETVEPFLMTLITRTTFFRNGAEYLNLGGQEVPYDKNFLLYMTTNMKYPHYSPEMFDKITIIDFSMNREALEEHLLTCVVEVEKPTLKKIKKTVNTQRKRNKDALYNIEERILKTLSESKTDILEDEQALQILDESKILSKEIQEKQEALKDTELILKEFRSGYETIAKHSTTLYFTTFELTKINHMYQFSYNWFVETYSESIQKAEKFKELPRRRKSLMETITYELYCKISRSIFEKDKLFFSFLLCTNLLLAERKISLDEIQFFAKSWGKSEQDQPCPEWLPPKRWRSICNLHNLTSYSNFTRFFLDNETKFREIYNSKNPETEPFPEPFNSSFNKLLIISLIRPDRLYKGIHNFVAQELGTKFVNPPSFDIATSFIESHILSPLIFILKPGSDPVKSLVNFARTKHFHNKLTLMSIKNGQEEYVEASISEGKNLGLWICLQNCHLLTNWLPFLDLKLEEVDYSNTHENFRLWLTTNECQDFPISLLERSVKITKEPPKGLRNKLINLFQDDPVSCPKFYANCPGKQEAFVRLLYSLAFFHCILQERQNFGSYGWNVSYGFNKNDFFISIHELQSIVNNRLDPLEEIVYLLEKCSYGGYVRDAMDNRLLGVIVRNYINPRVLQNNCDTNFVNGLPTKTDHQDCINHILKLPETDDCEIFGLNENFESIKGLRESKPLLKSIQVTFNDIIYAKVLTNPAHLIQDLLQQLPPEFVSNKENEKTKDGIINLITLKEKKSYNELIKTIRTSLTDLQEVVDGRLLMTEELEELAKSLVANQIPEIWMRKAYVNSFCLTSFVEDLIARIDYFKNLSCSPGETIWLASFFNPKAFLTANKLLYSKKYSVLMDDVHFCLKNNTEGLNSEGFVLVNGLHLVGARWNEESECLDELPVKILHEALPPVSFVFTIDKQRNMYECPLYKKSNLHSYFGRGDTACEASDNTCLKRVIFGGELRDFLVHLGEDTGIYV